MERILHKSNSRGLADHGWLQSRHTFSFANYYNPSRMGFGALRVINDDIVAPGMGFGTHPHHDMEIVSIPLRGSLHHKDTMGNDFIIQKNEVQVMSAGTGIQHSEFNNSGETDTNFLQIWVLPEKMGIDPTYSQEKFSQEDQHNQFQLVVSPDGRNGSVSINQQAFFSLIKLQKGHKQLYHKYIQENGLYLFVIEGEIKTDETLQKRDGLALKGFDNVELEALQDSELLLMEVPFIANA